MSWSLRTTKTREEPGAASPPPARTDPVRAQRPTRTGPELSRGRGPTSAVEARLAHQHLSGAPLEAQLPGGRVGAGHHLREGVAGAWGRTGHPRDPPSRSSPLPAPHHQRRLRVHLLHGPNRARLLPAGSRGGPAAAARAAACRRPRGLRRGFSSAPPLGARHPAGSRLPSAPTAAPPWGWGRRRGRSLRIRRRLRKAPAGRERAEERPGWGGGGRAEGGEAGLRGVFALGCPRRFSRAGGGWIRPQQRSTRSLGRPRCFAAPNLASSGLLWHVLFFRCFRQGVPCRLWVCGDPGAVLVFASLMFLPCNDRVLLSLSASGSWGCRLLKGMFSGADLQELSGKLWEIWLVNCVLSDRACLWVRERLVTKH